MQEAPKQIVLSREDAVMLGATNGPIFSSYFFPKTFRQAVPSFHANVWDALLFPGRRYVNVIIFRGGAKTTLLRSYMAHRLAYSVSRTVMYIGASQRKAETSTGWLLRQVQNNHLFSETFGLEVGAKGTPGEFNIVNKKTGDSTWFIGLGVLGSVRGINFDDYRPDLIIVDDALTDQNAATEMGQEKIIDLILGAVRESLTPGTENPAAQMALLNTPHDVSDLTSYAAKDPAFYTVKFGIWTPETETLPIEHQESIWPERYPTEEVRAEKRNAIAMNRYSIWAREKECNLVNAETSDFKQEWVTYYDPDDIPEKMVCVIAIDPVPPPSPEKIKMGLGRRDFECIAVVGIYKGEYYVLEYRTSQGHTPNWSVSTFFELAYKWKPLALRVESTMYQKTLAWLIREEMKRRGRYWPVMEVDERAPKHVRIVNALQGPLSNRALKFRRNMSDAVSQVVNFPNVAHDDIIEAIAEALLGLTQYMTLDLSANDVDEEGYEELGDYRGAP